MNEAVEPTPPSKPIAAPSLIRRIGIYAVVLLVVFLLGFVPMWIKSRSSRIALAEIEEKLTLAQTENSFAASVIYARRGEYEPARLAASQFFTSLRAEVDKGDDSAFTAAQRAAVQPLFGQRDEIITLLARSDPAAENRLSDLFASYRKIMSG